MNKWCIWIQSFPPFRRSAICPICFEYKWLHNKSMTEFEKKGCLTCSLKIKYNYDQLENQLIGNIVNNFNDKYKTTGRYD
jgi:hypothetical protein